jgi:hypothetical protein
VRFLSRIMSSVSQGSPARQDRRSTGRRRSQFELESLETRDLMSGVTATLQFGNLLIKDTSSTGGNNVTVSILSGILSVAITGQQTKTFTAHSVLNTTFVGSTGGGDIYHDNTSLVSLDHMYGSNNVVTGSLGFNYVFFYQSHIGAHDNNNNTFTTAAGSINDVFQEGGTGDTINDTPGTVYLKVYS